jgi:hypothetical protein
MEPVEGGLSLVLGATAAFAALVAFQSAFDNSEGNIVQRAGMWLFTSLCMTPVMFAIFSFFGGLALLAWQTYQYLRFGDCLGWKLAHVLYLLDSKFEQTITGWVGVDQIVLWLLNGSALLALLLIMPVSALLMVGIALWLLASLWNWIRV